MVRLAGAEPVVLAAGAEAGYKVTPEGLDGAITERTRAVILNSPSNPTGAVYSPDELAALADVVGRHPGVLVVSDEIYEYVTFGARFVSFASIGGMAERTATVNGFSKGFAMTGWRLGYLAGPDWLVKAAAKVQSQLTSGPSAVTQYAAVPAYTMDRQPVEAMVAAFRERRDAVLARLRAVDGVACPTPDGAFYLFPDVSAFYGRRTPAGDTVGGSVDLCRYPPRGARRGPRPRRGVRGRRRRPHLVRDGDGRPDAGVQPDRGRAGGARVAARLRLRKGPAPRGAGSSGSASAPAVSS